MQSTVTSEGTSGGIPDDVIDNSDFTLEVDERGYDSDSESGSDDGDDPVGGASEPHPPSSALPRNTSEKVSTEDPAPKDICATHQPASMLYSSVTSYHLPFSIVNHDLPSHVYVLSSVSIKH